MSAKREEEQCSVLLRTLVESRHQLVECANRIVKCASHAEDIVQDAAVKICLAGGCVDVLNPKSYLCRMVRNLAIDFVRRSVRAGQLAAAESSIENIAAPSSCPQRRMESCQSLQAISAALAAQPARMSAVFVRHRIEGVPQKDLAAEIGVSPALVNFMIRDATKICRRAVEDLDARGA
jgi:RNA polymerase sigma-70 factor (ECF subfamily)